VKTSVRAANVKLMADTRRRQNLGAGIGPGNEVRDARLSKICGGGKNQRRGDRCLAPLARDQIRHRIETRGNGENRNRASAPGRENRVRTPVARTRRPCAANKSSTRARSSAETEAGSRRWKNQGGQEFQARYGNPQRRLIGNLEQEKRADERRPREKLERNEAVTPLDRWRTQR
jgi:hypothetical protein